MNDSDDEATMREGIVKVRDMHLNSLKILQNELCNVERSMQLTIGELTVRAEQLRHHFHKLEGSHTLYCQCTKLASNKIYDMAQRKYLQSLAKVEDRIKELNREEQTCFRPAASSTMVSQGQTVYRVEPNRRPQIGKFNGDPAEWLGFRDVFLAEVDRKDYEPVTKLIHLRDACTDKAARVLGTWPLTAANYKLAWESMMHAFNDDYQMVHGIMDKMYNVQPAEEESIDDMQDILNVLNNDRRQLKSMCSRKILEEQMFIHYATWRMAPSTRDAWEQYRNRDKAGGLVSLDEMKQFLHFKTRVHTRASTSNVASGSPTDENAHSPRQDELRERSKGHQCAIASKPICPDMGRRLLAS